MKKVILFLFVFVSLFTSCSKDAVEDSGNGIDGSILTLAVSEAGSLPQKIDEASMYKITKLKLKGKLNSTDVWFLREMAGYFSKGILSYLDLSEAEFVAGGKPYLGDLITEPNKVSETMFYDCKALTEVKIPQNTVTIGRDAFKDCPSLLSFDIPNSVKNIEYGAFWNCSNLSSITLPNSLTYIGDWAFYGTKIHELTIPTSVEICSLSGMDKLEVLRIEDSEKPMDLELYLLNLKYLYLGRNISADNFSHLKDLCSELEIGEKVTEICDNEPSGRMGIGTINIHNGIKTIGKNAFYNTYLSNVVLPPSVERIGWRGLYVYGLENLTLYTKNPPQVAENCFYEPSECTLYVPKGCIDNYKNNEKWKGFKEYKEIDNYLWEPR